MDLCTHVYACKLVCIDVVLACIKTLRPMYNKQNSTTKLNNSFFCKKKVVYTFMHVMCCVRL